jgi:putrescine transport system permease protein
MNRMLVLLPSWAWLIAFTAVPVGIVAAISVSQSTIGIPPYTLDLDFSNFLLMVQDSYYLNGFVRSLVIAAVSAGACLVIGYPIALAIARTSTRYRSLLLLLVILPFWTGFLLRITAWIGLLRDDGWVNAVLLALHLTSAPLVLLHTNLAMYLGIVYCYLPFLVLPLQSRLTRADPTLEQAAADLGASPWQVFRTVTWPLSLPGVWAGLALVFVPVTGEYVIPELLGGPGSLTIGRMLADEFFQNRDWPMASALAVTLLVAVLVPAALFRRGA